MEDAFFRNISKKPEIWIRSVRKYRLVLLSSIGIYIPRYLFVLLYVVSKRSIIIVQWNQRTIGNAFIKIQWPYLHTILLLLNFRVCAQRKCFKKQLWVFGCIKYDNEWFRWNFLSSVNPEILMSDTTYCFVTEQLLFIQKHDTTTALVGSPMRIIQ